MILPDLVLTTRANQRWQYSGIDSPDRCLDKKHFKSYPHVFEYQYNSRGFRDCEWPDSVEELEKSIWCVGDSFTAGLGSPLEHIWPYQLEKITNTRTINVGMDGASNQWIARQVTKILEEISPAVLVVQWSYLHRYEINNDLVAEEQRQRHFDSVDLFNEKKLYAVFVQLLQQIESIKGTTRVIHSFIPDSGVTVDINRLWNQLRGKDWPDCPTNLTQFRQLDRLIVDELKTLFHEYDYIENYFEWCVQYQNLLNQIDHVPEIVRLDLARDGHHYDLLTAQQFARDVGQLLSKGSI